MRQSVKAEAGTAVGNLKRYVYTKKNVLTYAIANANIIIERVLPIDGCPGFVFIFQYRSQDQCGRLFIFVITSDEVTDSKCSEA